MAEKKLNEKGNRFAPLKTLLLFVILMWLFHGLSLFLPLRNFGIIPREIGGLTGILLSPLLHGDLQHLLLNTSGLMIFGFIFVMLEGRDTISTVLIIYFLQGMLTWIFARSAIHIGASGLIFGLYGYLLMVGFFQKKLRYLIVSIIILFSYGSMILGVLPSSPHISWEGHLAGFVSGGITARFR